MPHKWHNTKARNKNAQRAREARLQKSQGELCRPSHSGQYPPMILISIKNKDRSNIPASQLFQPAIEESDDGQGDDEMDINNLEIVEQLALDHFSVFLREAQELAD